jgi:hypothetical protein
LGCRACPLGSRGKTETTHPSSGAGPTVCARETECGD